ncbi:unnamed protein product, partial [Callosobruchus maculatus]
MHSSKRYVSGSDKHGRRPDKRERIRIEDTKRKIGLADTGPKKEDRRTPKWLTKSMAEDLSREDVLKA